MFGIARLFGARHAAAYRRADPRAYPGAGELVGAGGPVGPPATTAARVNPDAAARPSRNRGRKTDPVSPNAVDVNVYHTFRGWPAGHRPGAEIEPQYENVPEFTYGQPSKMPRYRIIDPYENIVPEHARFAPQALEGPYQRMPPAEVATGPDGRASGAGAQMTNASSPSATSFAWHPAAIAAPKLKAPAPPQ